MQEKEFNYLVEKVNDVPTDFDLDDRSNPDIIGKELYDDEKEAFFGEDDNIINWQQKKRAEPPFFTIKVMDKGYLYSSDYIGPSIYWAREKGISDKEICSFLTVCRRLGGHILLPRGGHRQKDIYTPNQAKAGSNGVYDRFDWFLHLLKIYYEAENLKDYMYKANLLLPEDYRNKKNFNDKFKLIYKSINFYKKEFLYFESFKGYCDRFLLVGSFVNEEYEIINMSNLLPILPEDYNSYIEKLCKAIETRNAKMHEDKKQ